MKTATVRDLRYSFPRVMKWIEEGESVEVTRHGRVIARLSPALPLATELHWPDFASRLEKTFSAGLIGAPLSEIVSESRGER